MRGFPELYGVCIYAFMCHHSLPSIIAPLRDKSSVFRLFTIVCELRYEPTLQGPVSSPCPPPSPFEASDMYGCAGGAGGRWCRHAQTWRSWPRTWPWG
jgi:hypothetical protein